MEEEMKTKTKDGNRKEKNISRKDNVMCLIAFSLHLTDSKRRKYLRYIFSVSSCNTFTLPVQFPYLIILRQSNVGTWRFSTSLHLGFTVLDCVTTAAILLHSVRNLHYISYHLLMHEVRSASCPNPTLVDLFPSPYPSICLEWVVLPGAQGDEGVALLEIPLQSPTDVRNFNLSRASLINFTIPSSLHV
jgi:hypothetical protein